MFYDELFAINPSLRSMFRDDMQVQETKFLSALSHIVRALDAPNIVLEDIRKLAQTHVGYGVKPEHYTSFGNALLRTLKRTLGADFTPDLSRAWSIGFRAIVQIMNESSHGRASCSGPGQEPFRPPTLPLLDQ